MSTDSKGSAHEATIKEMFKAGAHFGYSRSRRHPSMMSYIFGYKNKTAILDIEKTAEDLARACDFVRELGRARKMILFVGNKNEARSVIKNGAEEIGMPYVNLRWMGGTLTNFKEIRKRIDRLNDWKDKGQKGELSVYTKKERLLISKEMEDLEKFFGGIASMNKLPAAMFVVDAKEEHTAVAEAKKIKIPVVSLSNADCNLRDIEYPIVANDASMSSISLFVHKLVEAYEEGLHQAKDDENGLKTA